VAGIGIYRHVCPYCNWLGMSGASSRYHLKTVHPDKPRPSDKDFPGWREASDNQKILP